MVVNDEAHHVHDAKLKWNQTIERLHDELRKRTPDDSGAGAVSQLDYSATPKYEKGGIFRHVVVDYPLAQAVADGIVKTPVIGEVSGAQVELGDTAFSATVNGSTSPSGAGACSTKRSRRRASARSCS
jgi:type III restriction enzyme